MIAPRFVSLEALRMVGPVDEDGPTMCNWMRQQARTRMWAEDIVAPMAEGLCRELDRTIGFLGEFARGWR
jgi:hypothetical protein